MDEVVGVLFANVLYSIIVNDGGENDGLGGVLQYRRCYGHRGEAEMGEVSFELVVVDAAGLLEAGHAFTGL